MQRAQALPDSPNSQLPPTWGQPDSPSSTFHDATGTCLAAGSGGRLQRLLLGGARAPSEAKHAEIVDDWSGEPDELRNDRDRMPGNVEEHRVPGVLATVDPAFVEHADDFDCKLGKLTPEHQNGKLLPTKGREDRMRAQGLNESDSGEEEASVPECVGHHEEDGVEGRLLEEPDNRVRRKERREKDRNLPCEADRSAEPEEPDDRRTIGP